jgi:signal transduction histidine kinase
VRRRILTAIVAITALAIASFGVPLALALQRQYRDQAILRLEREVAHAAVSVPASFAASGDPIELPAPDDGTTLGVYSGGKLVAGEGPRRADRFVDSSTRGRIVDGDDGTSLVVAAPVTADEHVFAVVRAALPRSELDGRVRRAWLAMAMLGLLILALASVVSAAIARRLSRPVADLADAAERLGAGDFAARAGRSGLAELDLAAANLDATAERLGEVLQRERAFSADASHQLRTPLTGLRLHLEAAVALAGPDSAPSIEVALGEVDRLERTIDDLLALARDTRTVSTTLDLEAVLDDVRGAWHGPLASAGRPLAILVDPDLPAGDASGQAVRQILDVLVANASEHGGGAVRVHARAVRLGLAIDVSDEGPGIEGDPEAIFERRSGAAPDRGIGLALARSLADAEGGRLLVRHAGPHPTFTLVLRLSSPILRD